MQSNPDQIADLTAMQELVERGLLLLAFEEAECQILVFDAASRRVIAANKQAQALLGATMRTLQKQHITDVIPKVDPVRFQRILSRVQRRRTQSASLRCRLGGDAPQMADVGIRYVPGKKDSLIVFIRDLTLASAAKRQADLAEDRLQTAIEALTDGFILFDADDRLVMCNDRYRELYKESSPALVSGAKLEDILRYGLRNNQYALGFGTEDEWVARQVEAFKNLSMSSEQRLNDGRWLRVVERPTADGGRVGLRIDITHLKEQQDELRRLSRTDDLTGLLNRRGLSRRIEVLAAGAAGPARLAILHVDLDRFKTVNDTLGHDAGDFVLQHCAQILSSGRPPADAIARVGGDEFILVIRTERPDKTIIRYARKLISLLSEPVMFREQGCSVGASIGISFISEENAIDFGDVLTAADIALNQAKALGGSEALVFHPDMRAQMIHQTNMAREIERGIKNNEFVPFFQPQIDTFTDQILGFEALIRWHHPVLGTVPAFQFLPIAQRAGLTDALDDVVMDRACAALRDLKEWGLHDPCISINLSMGQISDPRIVTRLGTHLKRYGVCTENLRIELLESTLLDDRSSTIIQNVHALIKAGFMVELDDFGTGHAAIATLRKFAVSRIKVDRSLVQNIDTDAELQVITAAVINLAKRLGIDALAEGVETVLEQSTLQKMGCFLAQGYLHAKPMSLSDIKPWLQARGDIPIDDFRAGTV
ncbi:diguanylate cyclase (GGDEF) domain-containing protein [Cognatiyoonia koreensis]|uniref:Diguanylate cyclase (GGDEF) domain-containing protein n=1 Tax=Cognatiyoonia koreensis TaxID=364200 RepID=A0A1I0RTH9_9RHOB|nr:EAL domain-containing protein [Cognatiyoonia koreensis]SEW44683.1 diguanylate cyclase (GGDEF) domain-containing protein [Cognatiyoonia koreensis]